MINIRVRFAPSPTGPLHIGGIRTAIYNYIYTKKNRGKFILRIEDTDINRIVSGTEKYIIDTLEWAGLSPDESPFTDEPKGRYSPYRQSYRKHLYFFYLQKLLEKGNAFYAINNIEKKYYINSYNSKRNLEFPYVIRFNIPKYKYISVYDEIRGKININTLSIDNKILIKSNGVATYHLANVIDDHLMKITHVIRGEEWLSSAPLHILIYEALEWEWPLFAHLPLILKVSGGGKLSKRDRGEQIFPLEWTDTNTNSIGYRETGSLPEALVNMITFLGWNSGKKKEFFCLKQLEKNFFFKKVQKAGAFLNKRKAYWFNKQFFQRKKIGYLIIFFNKEYNKYGHYTYKNNFLKIIKTVIKRIYFFQELWDNSHYFFINPQIYYNHYIIINDYLNLNKLKLKILKEKSFNSFNLKRIINSFNYDNHLMGKKILQILRIVIIGSMNGEDIFFIMEMIGKKEFLKRIRKYY